jgi:protein-disulfide isomerase
MSLAAVLFLVLAAAAPPKTATPAPRTAPSPAPASDVLAFVGGDPLSTRDLEQYAASRVFLMKNQQYQAQRQLLDELIAKRLLEKEAAARGVALEALVKQEVEAKVPAVTEAEQKEFYAQNKARMGDLPEAAALVRVAEGLRNQRLQARNAEFVGELKRKAAVRVLLEAPRAEVVAGSNPARGPADAPVTIIEFSDFQCPYCSRAAATLKRIEEAYPGKVRIVFRDFPLLQIHPFAAKAAEAAGCADEQGKFWPVHDHLFSHQDKLQVADLKQYAVDLGLEATKFNECLDSGRRATEWQGDYHAGETFGVQSTPAFFINGRLIVGAQPYEQFAQVVEEELARAGQVAAPSKPGGK